MGITDPFRTDTTNRRNPIIQPTIVQFYQDTILVHSDQNHFPIGSLDSGTDAPISGRNIDNRTEMNPQGPIGTTTLESNREKNVTSSTWSKGLQILPTGDHHGMSQ